MRGKSYRTPTSGAALILFLLLSDVSVEAGGGTESRGAGTDPGMLSDAVPSLVDPVVFIADG